MNQTGKAFQPLNSVAVILIISVFLLSFASICAAKSNVVPVEGIKYSVDTGLTDNLKALQGKKVTLTLTSGKVMTGMVKTVGNHLMHLEKLSGKEFYDALIRIKDIGAIETRFRTIKR